MALVKGFTSKSIGKNIETEEKAGMGRKKATAIALSVARKAARKDPSKDAKKKLKGLMPKGKKAKKEVARDDERYGKKAMGMEKG